MQPHAPRFKEWLAAERQANEIERELYLEMLESAKGAPPPNAALVLAARAKRADAQRLFDEAMHEMRRLAESLHHRRIETRTASRGAGSDGQH